MKTRSRPQSFAFVFAAFTAAFTLTSCTVSENLATCSALCSRYGECFDDELDIDGCTGDCLDSADRNNAFVSDVDRCEKCMNMEGCRESAFDCFDECGRVTGQSVVP